MTATHLSTEPFFFNIQTALIWLFMLGYEKVFQDIKAQSGMSVNL